VIETCAFCKSLENRISFCVIWLQAMALQYRGALSVDPYWQPCARISGWERTSLEKHIRFFRTSFLQPLLKACKAWSALPATFPWTHSTHVHERSSEWTSEGSSLPWDETFHSHFASLLLKKIACLLFSLGTRFARFLVKVESQFFFGPRNVCMQEDIGSAYNAKVQESKDSMNW
jgi:hypothetical protein